MKAIKLFFSQFYEMNKREYWLLFVLNIVAGLILYHFHFNTLIEYSVVFMMFIKTLAFIRSANVMPSISSEFDRFSWKYFQGLPLSKSEILLALVSTHAFVLSSILVFVLSFLSHLAGIFSENAKYESMTALGIFLFSLPVIVIIGFSMITSQITFPRRQYSKNDTRIIFYNGVKKLLICLTVFAYSIWAMVLMHEHLEFDIGKYLAVSVKHTASFLFSWWGLLPVVALAIASYFHTLRVWQDEKRGYVKINWSHKRDFSIAGGCLLALIIPFSFEDDKVPSQFRDSALVKASYVGDVKTVEDLIKSGQDINTPNKYGVAPIHASIAGGRKDVFHILLNNRANLKAVVKGKIKNGYDGMNALALAAFANQKDLSEMIIAAKFPLNDKTLNGQNTPAHLAAKYCYTPILDQLIKAGADLNLRNREGDAPIHLATKSKCFGSVTSLVDAGVNPNVPDKNGKTPYSYVQFEQSRATRDLAYYLEKKGRFPAGK